MTKTLLTTPLPLPQRNTFWGEKTERQRRHIDFFSFLNSSSSHKRKAALFCAKMLQKASQRTNQGLDQLLHVSTTGHHPFTTAPFCLLRPLQLPHLCVPTPARALGSLAWSSASSWVTISSLIFFLYSLWSRSLSRHPPLLIQTSSAFETGSLFAKAKAGGGAGW